MVTILPALRQVREGLAGLLEREGSVTESAASDGVSIGTRRGSDGRCSRCSLRR